jgi:hypothetical protein
MGKLTISMAIFNSYEAMLVKLPGRVCRSSSPKAMVKKRGCSYEGEGIRFVFCLPQWRLKSLPPPIGSMYGIYANIWGILMYIDGKCYHI